MRLPARLLTTPLRDVAGLALLFAIAFVIRLVPVLRGGGLHFYGRYDDGVYYTAAESLTFGHLPYRDFVLLHPPGGALAFLPFSLLGRLTTDPTGLAAGRIAMMALGALCAVLVAVLAAQWGRPQALLAGLMYAGSATAVYSEQSTFLEPLGGVLVLVALLVLVRHRRTDLGARVAAHAPSELVAGVALGLSCTVKIWYVAPFAAVVLVLALGRAWRTLLRVVASGVLATSVVLVPFFAQAPRQMWTMVVTDQLGRGRHVITPLSRWERVTSILGTSRLHGTDAVMADVLTVAVVAAAALAVAVCLVDRRARVVAAVAIADAATLLASPSYFNHYGALLAGPLAVVLAVGLGAVVARLRPLPVRALLVCGAAVLVLATGLTVAARPTGETFPGKLFAAAAPAGCISADDPGAMIEMNRLTADLRQHCPVAVDVTGASYGAPMRRRHNVAFHRWLIGYLTHGDAFVVVRPKRDVFSAVEQATLRRQPTIATARGLYLRAGVSATGAKDRSGDAPAP